MLAINPASGGRPLWQVMGCPDPTGHPLYQAVFDNMILDCRWARLEAGVEDWQLMADRVASTVLGRM